EKLTRAWLQRDLTALERISAEAMAGEDPDMVAAFDREVVIRRNHRMVTRMQPKLAEGAAFIAVGALHLPGKAGILNLLRQQGYRVTAVY
ncbi:MAG TPA: TraB/GumN family protein, partial [Gammaproteobacteria bacterium]|nr:TraB/GumN family protein [Gammaproteobacteria bacterium]